MTIQLYDPYNFMAVNLFEYTKCTGSSTSLGVRNFTVSGRSKDPVYTEWPSSNYTLVYPALNADSMLVPPYVKV